MINRSLEKIKFPGLFLFLMIFLFQPVTTVNAHDSDAAQDPETHKVFVDVMLVPVFVVGPDGEPVFDLGKKDFELYANGSPIEISQFIKFDFEHRQEVLEEVVVKGKKVAVRQPSRAVFIIIDSVFNSYFGYRRAKQIAINIINNGSPEDMFIVLENKAAGGPRHIAGPDENKNHIIREIKKLKLPSTKWDKNLHLTREYNILSDTNQYDPVEVAVSLENLNRQKRYMEKMAYKNQAHHFSDFLAQLKYALKTMARPKVVFLISEGISKAAFKTLEQPEVMEGYGKFGSVLTRTEERVNQQNEFRDPRLFRDLQRVVKAMNEGGSVLYTVNPGRIPHDDEASGEMSLRVLAHQSGGQYIAGRDTKKIVRKVKKTTAAYYELVFVPTADMGKNIDIQVKCKREGLKVNTFKQTERSKPYYRMEPVEKKLFALNMVTGGSWSRIIGKVVRIKYRNLRNENQNGETISLIEIPLPPKMRGRQLDLFFIQFNPQTKKVKIELLNQKLKDRANLIIRKKENTKEFFVIIEPVFTYCVYNQV